jgi:hypothetical protein
VHQQALGAHRIPIENVAVFIGADMHAAGEELPVLDGAEGILEIHLTGADGFDLGPEKLDPGFKALKHKVFMKSLAILRDLLGTGLLRHFSHILPGAFSMAL